MDSAEHESDLEVEAWLTRARPNPQDDIIDHLEARLVRRTPRRAARARLTLAGLGFSGALAAVIMVVALAGGGPSAGKDGAAADEDCVTTQVTRTVPQGEIVQGADGRARVVTSRQTVTTAVKRCR